MRNRSFAINKEWKRLCFIKKYKTKKGEAMGKIYSVAIIGCGSRGQNVYGKYMHESKEQFKIISLCDISEVMLGLAKDKFGVASENCFTDVEAFFAEKRADVLVIATQDRDHVAMCVKALELGYDVLLEKPISPIESELYQLLDAQKKYGGKVVVCHVLRYAPAFIKVKKIIESGDIGKIISIDWTEQVAYWHQAHSFVRGNWRNDQETSPMIMQKCCHDLDLLQYYADSKCDFVYSVGSTSFFNRENQPKDAADRCQDCKYINTCPYSAERVYVQQFVNIGSVTGWPFDVVDVTRPITVESLRKAYQSNQYGRCVFACDNNVVDNQNVIIQFENNVKATLTMTGFTGYAGRKVTIHGTLGEIEMDENRDMLKVSIYGEEKDVYDVRKSEAYSIADIVNTLGKDEFGHGGGDQLLVQDFYQALTGETDAETTLEKSIESHLMALAAEKSRKSGKTVKLREN